MPVSCDTSLTAGIPPQSQMALYKPYCDFANHAVGNVVHIKIPNGYTFISQGIGSPADLTCGHSHEHHHTIVVRGEEVHGDHVIQVTVPYHHNPTDGELINLYVFDDHNDLMRKETKGHSKSAVPVRGIGGTLDGNSENDKS